MDDLTLHWKLPPATIFFFPPFCFTCNQNQKEIATSKNHFRTDNDWHCVSCVFVASVFLFFFCCVFLKKFAKIFSTFWFGTSKHKSTFKKISRKSTGTWFLFTKIVHYKFTHTDIHHLLLFDFLFILLTNLFVPCPLFFFFFQIRSKPANQPPHQFLSPLTFVLNSRCLLRMLLPFVYGALIVCCQLQNTFHIFWGFEFISITILK